MDFRNLVDGIHDTACVLSVEKKQNGEFGEIRIVAGNDKFIAVAEEPPFGVDRKLQTLRFEPDSPYDKYLPKTPDFEQKCYQAAVLKKTVYTYIYLNVCDMWFNMFFWPVAYETDELAYCVYATEPCDVDDIGMASLNFSAIAEEVLKTCIKLRGARDFIKTMNDVIGDVRNLCGAQVCTVMVVNHDKGTSNILAKSTAADSTIKALTQYPNMYDIAMSWIDTLGERDCIIIRNEKEMEYAGKVNYPWYQTLKESGVKSIILFPLRYNREHIGFIWTTNFDVDNTERIKEALELTTFFISSEIANYLILKKLEHISYTDLLTGIFNRNAMNGRIAAITAGEETFDGPYGVVFADLNGLKRVNDEEGHDAGDILIKKAALLLQEVFKGGDIYRAGGDEFMIIVPRCTEQSFNTKVEQLRARASDPGNVSLSVGSVFNSSGLDIRDLLKTADEAMYADKECYYEKWPERRYR